MGNHSTNPAPMQCHLNVNVLPLIHFNQAIQMPLCHRDTTQTNPVPCRPNLGQLYQWTSTFPKQCHSATGVPLGHCSMPLWFTGYTCDRSQCKSRMWQRSLCKSRASDARGSSERLRRFMQRVALVRSVILGGYRVICNPNIRQLQQNKQNKHQMNIP